MTRQQRQTVHDLISEVSDCLAYIKKRREGLMDEPIVARTTISATGRSGLAALYAARRVLGFNDAVRWLPPRGHEKWSVGAIIPGSAENTLASTPPLLDAHGGE